MIFICKTVFSRSLQDEYFHTEIVFDGTLNKSLYLNLVIC